MLWLAGFLGLMAVGTVTMVDFSDPETETELDDPMPDQSEVPFVLAQSFLAPAPEIPDGAAAFFEQADPDMSEQEYYEDEDGDGDGTFEPGFNGTPSTISMADVIAFDPEHDGLMVVWDDALGSPPEIELVENSDDPWMTDIRCHNGTLAHIRADEAVTPDNISLVPLSTAQQFGWTSA